MSIQKISKEQLRRMGDQEGLILQGCGDDPQEWLDGINQILTGEGILKKGTFMFAYCPEKLDKKRICKLFKLPKGLVVCEEQTASPFGLILLL